MTEDFETTDMYLAAYLQTIADGDEIQMIDFETRMNSDLRNVGVWIFNGSRIEQAVKDYQLGTSDQVSASRYAAQIQKAKQLVFGHRTPKKTPRTPEIITRKGR